MTKRNNDLFQELTPQETAELLENLSIGTPSEAEQAAIARIQERVLAEVNDKQHKSFAVLFTIPRIAAAFVACLAVIVLSLVIWRHNVPQIGRIDEGSCSVAETAQPYETNAVIPKSGGYGSPTVTQGSQTTAPILENESIDNNIHPSSDFGSKGTSAPQSSTAKPNTAPTVAATAVPTHATTAVPTVHSTVPTQTPQSVTTGGTQCVTDSHTARTTFPPPHTNVTSPTPSYHQTTHATNTSSSGKDVPNPCVILDVDVYTTTTTTTTVPCDIPYDGSAADVNHDGTLSIADGILLAKNRRIAYDRLNLLFDALSVA